MSTAYIYFERGAPDTVAGQADKSICLFPDTRLRRLGPMTDLTKPALVRIRNQHDSAEHPRLLREHQSQQSRMQQLTVLGRENRRCADFRCELLHSPSGSGCPGVGAVANPPRAEDWH